MSYADQRGMLRSALESAGLSADAATNIANILANSAQEQLQSGRTRTDTTPDGLRYVGADSRKLLYQNLDFLPADPDYRPTRTSTSEQRDQPQQAPNVTSKLAPQQTDATYRVAGGSLADASGVGESVEVSVRHRVAKQPPGSLPVTMLDRQSNTLVGKSLRAASGGDDGRMRVVMQQGQQDVTTNINLENVTRHRVVTGIEFEPGVGLRVNYSAISAWDERMKDVRFLHMREQQVLTEVVDDLKGFRAHTAYIPTFPALNRANENNPFVLGNAGEDLYFNVFRVGKFTGGWATGAAKSVEQVWPEDGRTLLVKNYGPSVANTDSEKYVLFVPRTKDQLRKNANDNRYEIRGEDENPIPLLDPPEAGVDYYAIEIQPATECTAFSSLNGKAVSELTGYNAGAGAAKQALSHDVVNGCLEWAGATIEVITGVSRVGTELVFTKQKLHVLKSESASPTSFSLTQADAVYDIQLGEGGLHASRHRLLVLGTQPLSPVSVATSDCPDAGSGAGGN